MPEVLSYASSRDLCFSERRLPSQVHSRKPVRFSLVFTAYVNLPTTKAKKNSGIVANIQASVLNTALAPLVDMQLATLILEKSCRSRSHCNMVR